MTTKNIKATPIRIKECLWCGRSFIVPRQRKYNAVKYCCLIHKEYAYLEQHNKAQRRYMKKYKDLFKQGDRYSLGEKGLGQHREQDFLKEYKLIQKEKKRRGL